MSLTGECIDHGRKGNAKGYANRYHGGRAERLHRLVYVQTRGLPIEAIVGASVRHTCDNTRCINPEHLVLGTHADNMGDKVERGRSGRKLTMEQAREIREAYIHYPRGYAGKGKPNGYSDLASRYGVTVGAIYGIVSGKSYREGAE